MNTVDFSTYKFHCSGLRNLMVKSRSKSDPLSETTKAYLREIWIEEVFGRKKFITSAPMEKGTTVESDTLELAQQVTGTVLFKNNTQMSNEYVIGTPDNLDKKAEEVNDAKSSWDLWTFMGVTEDKAKKDYYYQVLGYMWLCGFKKGNLLYGLVNTPEPIIYDEWRKLAWRMTEEEAEAIVRKNHTFDDIPAEMRLKKFSFEWSQDDIDTLIEKIELSREYLKGLSL